MNYQKLSLDLFQPLENSEMVTIVGGYKTKYKSTTFSDTNGGSDFEIKTVKGKD